MVMDLDRGMYDVPAGDGKSAPVRIDLAKVVQARTRLNEVAFVNVHKAPELLAWYNQCWLDLSHAVNRLTSEKLQAEETVRRKRAEALLSYTDEDVRKRGFAKSSQDLREALVELDEGVQQARDRFTHIRLVLDYLSDLRKAFENAYTSVKKIVGTNQLPTGHPNSPGQDDPFRSDPVPTQMPPGFGTAKHRF